MKYKFSHIALSSSSLDKRVLPIATQIYEILTNAGIELYFDENLLGLESITKKKCSSTKNIIKKSELLIAIGGDGTMLNCSRKYGSKGIPILGINLGNVGFLTDIAPYEMTSKLLEVIKGNFIEDRRFFLEASIDGKKEKYIALNEVVIHSGAIAQLIDFDLFIDDRFVYTQRADGLIVNSPTGSTAYSLSGGGPIMHPTLDAMLLVPMYPHALSSRPIVIDGNSEIRIDLIERNEIDSPVTCDGQVKLTAKPGDTVHVRKKPEKLTLLHPKGHNFYASCRDKLRWSNALVG